MTIRRDQLEKRTIDLAIEAGDPEGARAIKAHLAQQSDVGSATYCAGMIAVLEDRIRRDAADRDAVVRRDYAQVTDGDRQQAVEELAVLYGSSRYATSNARTDETEHVTAVEMRSRSIARNRVARENRDATLRLEKPRAIAPVDEPDPFDPLRNGVANWTKGGR